MAGTDYAADTDYEARAVPLLPSRLDRAVIAIVRVGVALLWVQNVGGKSRPISVRAILRVGCTNRPATPSRMRSSTHTPG